MRASRHWALLGLVGAMSAALGRPAGVHAGAARSSSSGSDTSAVTAFVDVSVVPMDQERVLTGQTVLVTGDRISVVGPVDRVRVPAGAQRIDGRGKFLLPGLADMHAHLAEGVHVATTRSSTGTDSVLTPPADSAGTAARLFLWLANGVTTIRNMDYASTEHGRRALQWRARAAAGREWLPHIYTAGLWGPPVYAGLVHQDKTKQLFDGRDSLSRDSVAPYLRAYQAAGYDFVSVHQEQWDIIGAVQQAAKSLGLPVAGYVPWPVHVECMIQDGGVASMEYPLSEYVWNVREKPTTDTAGIAVLAAKLRAAHIAHCPTQQHYERLHVTGPSTLKVEQDSGVTLLLGTDDLPWVGVMTRELQAMVAAGLTPYQALLTGTRNVARFFGTTAQSGTIGVGKRADLVLLTGNPLRDVRYTAQPAGVMLGGRWLSRAAIDRQLAALRLPTFTIGTGMRADAPVQSYWRNVAEALEAEALKPLGDVSDPTLFDRLGLRALQTTHQAQLYALADSLGTSDHFAFATERLLRLLAQQLGEDRRAHRQTGPATGPTPPPNRLPRRGCSSAI